MVGIACSGQAIRPPGNGGKSFGRSASERFQHSGARFRPSGRPRSAARVPVLMLSRGISRRAGAEHASKTKLLRHISRSSLFNEPKRDDRRESFSGAARHPFRRGVGPPLSRRPGRLPKWRTTRPYGANDAAFTTVMPQQNASLFGRIEYPLDAGIEGSFGSRWRCLLETQKAKGGSRAHGREIAVIGCRLVWGIAEAGRPPCDGHGPAFGTFVPATLSAFRTMQRLPRRSGRKRPY